MPNLYILRVVASGRQIALFCKKSVLPTQWALLQHMIFLSGALASVPIKKFTAPRKICKYIFLGWVVSCHSDFLYESKFVNFLGHMDSHILMTIGTK
jgi:hypothetical protein